MISVVIADDQDLVRSGLRMILKPEPGIEVIGEASDGRGVLALVGRRRPDVVVMDVRMPVLDGIATTRELGLLRDPPPVLMLTTFDVNETIYEALRAGACGFLSKDASAERLIEAIRIVADGSSVFAPAATRRVIEEFASRSPLRALGEAAEITDRELDVVKQLVQGSSNHEIAQQLCVSENTVKSHLARILGKLGLRDRVQLVIWAYQHGIR